MKYPFVRADKQSGELPKPIKMYVHAPHTRRFFFTPLSTGADTLTVRMPLGGHCTLVRRHCTVRGDSMCVFCTSALPKILKRNCVQKWPLWMCTSDHFSLSNDRLRELHTAQLNAVFTITFTRLHPGLFVVHSRKTRSGGSPRIGSTIQILDWNLKHFQSISSLSLLHYNLPDLASPTLHLHTAHKKHKFTLGFYFYWIHEYFICVFLQFFTLASSHHQGEMRPMDIFFHSLREHRPHNKWWKVWNAQLYRMICLHSLQFVFGCTLISSGGFVSATSTVFTTNKYKMSLHCSRRWIFFSFVCSRCVTRPIRRLLRQYRHTFHILYKLIYEVGSNFSAFIYFYIFYAFQASVRSFILINESKKKNDYYCYTHRTRTVCTLYVIAGWSFQSAVILYSFFFSFLFFPLFGKKQNSHTHTRTHAHGLSFVAWPLVNTSPYVLCLSGRPCLRATRSMVGKTHWKWCKIVFSMVS